MRAPKLARRASLHQGEPAHRPDVPTCKGSAAAFCYCCLQRARAYRLGRVEEAAHSPPGLGAVVLGVPLTHGPLLGQVLLVPVVHQRLPAREVVLPQDHVALHTTWLAGIIWGWGRGGKGLPPIEVVCGAHHTAGPAQCSTLPYALEPRIRAGALAILQMEWHWLMPLIQNRHALTMQGLSS